MFTFMDLSRYIDIMIGINIYVYIYIYLYRVIMTNINTYLEPPPYLRWGIRVLKITEKGGG